MPTLVVAGAHDRIVRTEATERVASSIADGRLVVIPGCGHVPHEEAPEAVVEAVRPFLVSLDGRSARP